MIKVKDQSGNVVKGIYRDRGALIVDDDIALKKHLTQSQITKKNKDRIDTLENDIRIIKQLLLDLINK